MRVSPSLSLSPLVGKTSIPSSQPRRHRSGVTVRSGGRSVSKGISRHYAEERRRSRRWSDSLPPPPLTLLYFFEAYTGRAGFYR